jgi:hypothetical protein
MNCSKGLDKKDYRKLKEMIHKNNRAKREKQASAINDPSKFLLNHREVEGPISWSAAK